MQRRILVAGATGYGGPAVYTYNEIASLAFASLQKAPRIRRIPAWLVRLAARLLRPFDSMYATLAEASSALATQELIAPAVGIHTLPSFIAELAAADVQEKVL